MTDALSLSAFDDPADRVRIARLLTAIPTTIACDILREHSLSERSAKGLSPMTPDSRMAGPVRLIEFLPGRAELRRPGPLRNFAIIDTLGPAEVLVLCAGGLMEGAVLGDMLATRARERGGHGAVVDGAVRDLDGLAASGLPVLARGTAPMAAHSSLLPFACDRPIRFAGVTVLPDDWVLADRDGVLFLPPALVLLLLSHADAAMAKDAFSQILLTLGFALTEVFPLPEALAPALRAYQASGKPPDPATIRAALAGKD